MTSKREVVSIVKTGLFCWLHKWIKKLSPSYPSISSAKRIQFPTMSKFVTKAGKNKVR